MYLDALQIKFRENNQIQTVNIDPENYKLFKKIHPQILSIKWVRWRIL